MYTGSDATNKMDSVVNYINDMQGISDSYTYVLDSMLREVGQWKVGGAEEDRQAVDAGWGPSRWARLWRFLPLSPLPAAELVCEHAAAQVPRCGDLAEPTRGDGQGMEEGTGTRHAVLQ